jgi:two-component system chemotaxis response regulator CheY
MSGKRVLSIGQCMADHGSITRLLRTAFAADVVPTGSAHEALERLRSEAFDLVLVNRVFDATGESGNELIRQVKADGKLAAVSIMLVSNFPEAQDEAVAAGAIPGFGKSALHERETIDKLRPYLGA